MVDLDRVKVIKGLEEAYRVIEDYVPSRYRGYSRLACCDAIDLLREQGAVKPNTSCDGLPGEGGTWWYVCGNCNKEIDPDDAYCRHCGRAVTWDE